MAKPTNPKDLYSKKPMKIEKLAEKAGYQDKRLYEQHRREPNLRPENTKPRNRK